MALCGAEPPMRFREKERLPDVGYAFRARIENWASIYRDRKRPATSNIYPILHQLWVLHGVVKLPPSLQSIDTDKLRDAALLDNAICSLERADMDAIMGYYIKRRSLLSLAGDSGDFLVTWKKRLAYAEVNLRKNVDRLEKTIYSPVTN